MKYTIPGQPITKKNSMRLVYAKGRMIPLPSKQFVDYEREAEYSLRPLPDKPIDFPVEVKCIYYMPTKRKCDLTNLMEATHDILVKCGVLADDNFSVIESVDGSRVLHDKENPRVEIYIEEIKHDTE